MMQNDGKKFFSRSNILIWGSALAGIVSVEVFFNLREGPNEIIAGVASIIIGVLYCLAFLWLGKALSGRVNWQLQLLILAAVSTISVAMGFTALVAMTAPEPLKEFELFVPGQTVFYLILFFSALLTVLGFLWQSPKQKTDK